MAIKIKDLITELQSLNPEDYIVISRDPEGNGYGFLEVICINHKIHDGEVYIAELTPDLKEDGYSEEDTCERGVPCVVFYPGEDTDILEHVLLAGNAGGGV